MGERAEKAKEGMEGREGREAGREEGRAGRYGACSLAGAPNFDILFLMVRKDNTVLRDFLKVLLIPLLINKAFMLYFGLNYSDHPGEGYGYGLIATIIFLIFTVGRFLWKYRNTEDP
jgi:hypothetical protein